MQKTKKSLSADSKLQSALNLMKQKFNTTEFTVWKSKDITNRYRIGGSFPSALKSLGAIQTEYGTVKLTERFFTLRPSTVRKRMNKMVAESIKRTKTQTPSPVPTQVSKTDFDQLIIAIKKQVREEIVGELMSRLK